MPNDRTLARPLRRFEFTSSVPAAADEVWANVTAFTGINQELRPLLRRTSPPEWSRLELERIRLGERLFRSWVLLFGVLSIEYDDLTVVELGPGHRFLARSTMFTASLWEHERVVTARGADSCEVTDRAPSRPAGDRSLRSSPGSFRESSPIGTVGSGDSAQAVHRKGRDARTTLSRWSGHRLR